MEARLLLVVEVVVLGRVDLIEADRKSCKNDKTNVEVVGDHGLFILRNMFEPRKIYEKQHQGTTREGMDAKLITCRYLEFLHGGLLA